MRNNNSVLDRSAGVTIYGLIFIMVKLTYLHVSYESARRRGN